MNSDQKTIENKTKMPQGRLAGVYLRGFTLLEVIISVGILSVIVVAAIGIMLSIKVAQEKTANIQDIQDNIRYALEFMAKEMRQGSTYEPQPAGCALGTNSPCVGMKFMRGSGVVWYCLVNNTIYRYMGVYDLCNMSDALALTSDNIEVTNLNFYVLGNLPGPADGQPRVTIAITANSKDARIQLRSAFRLQATVTQRRRDGVARPSPVGFWKFDDGSGLTALDSSGNGNTGTLVSGPAWTVGQIGGALQFDGFDDYVSVSNENNFDFERTGSFTVTAWVKQSSPLSTARTIIGKLSAGGAYTGWELSLYDGVANSSGVTFYLINNYSSNNLIGVHTSSNVVPADQWKHIAVTYDGNGTASGIQIYVDGVPQSLVISQDTLSASILNNTNVYIGERVSAAQFPMNGLIDEVRIYNQALTQKQIQDIMVSL